MMRFSKSKVNENSNKNTKILETLGGLKAEIQSFLFTETIDNFYHETFPKIKEDF